MKNQPSVIFFLFSPFFYNFAVKFNIVQEAFRESFDDSAVNPAISVNMIAASFLIVELDEGIRENYYFIFFV